MDHQWVVTKESTIRVECFHAGIVADIDKCFVMDMARLTTTRGSALNWLEQVVEHHHMAEVIVM